MRSIYYILYFCNMKYLILIFILLASCTYKQEEVVGAYPACYGGHFYTPQDSLVVLVVRDHLAQKECVQSLDSIFYQQPYQVVPCTFSYNELMRVRQVILDFFMDSRNEALLKEMTLNAFGISMEKNRVFVSLMDSTDAHIDLFKEKIIDSPAVMFEQSKGTIVAH